MLDGLALRMDRVVDALGDGAAKPRTPLADVTPIPAMDRADKTTLDRVVASPANPADALARDRRTGAWIAALCAVVASAFLAWRWRSQRASARHGDAEVDGSADSAAWDEAHVLSDAVPQKEPKARAASSRPEHGIGAEDVIILDPMDADEPAAFDVEPRAASVVAPPQASPSTESKTDTRSLPPSDPHAPHRTAFHVDAKEPAVARASIESYLRHDPRVLQKPAPAVRSHEGGLSVECALLPGLAAGEREHLRAVLQRLASSR